MGLKHENEQIIYHAKLTYSTVTIHLPIYALLKQPAKMASTNIIILQNYEYIQTIRMLKISPVIRVAEVEKTH